ncbi:hypothetical protein DPMN_053894 [Dreissena polymorpha]|uniref:Uncharacterized protein n=1 Tax=Dreissena polymorpha TaxID=45954 RepID=A0A9D4HSM3_DREPO|nr:hypothetical protein DPMN_053894 [Dreissena polymorpha]
MIKKTGTKEEASRDSVGLGEQPDKSHNTASNTSAPTAPASHDTSPGSSPRNKS